MNDDFINSALFKTYSFILNIISETAKPLINRKIGMVEYHHEKFLIRYMLDSYLVLIRVEGYILKISKLSYQQSNYFGINNSDNIIIPGEKAEVIHKGFEILKDPIMILDLIKDYKQKSCFLYEMQYFTECVNTTSIHRNTTIDSESGFSHSFPFKTGTTEDADIYIDPTRSFLHHGYDKNIEKMEKLYFEL